jgi:hypothetical protein
MPDRNAVEDDDDDDALYNSAVALAKEVHDNERRIRTVAQQGGLDAETMTGELADTVMSLLSDMADQLVALAERSSAPDEILGIMSEDAQFIIKLLMEYDAAVAIMAQQPDSRVDLDAKQKEIARAIAIVRDLEIEEDDEDDDDDDDDEEEPAKPN